MNGGSVQYQRMHHTLPNHSNRPPAVLPPVLNPPRNTPASPTPSTNTSNILRPANTNTNTNQQNQQTSMGSRSTKLINSATVSRPFIAAAAANTSSSTNFHLNHHNIKKQQIHQYNNNRMHTNNHSHRNQYHASIIHETTNANINRVLKSHPHVKAELLEKISHLTNEKDISDYIKFYFDR
jgi:hypothetical protein